MTMQPNVVFVFADQWRAQATGYGGDPNVHTPNLDRLAAQSISFTNAVSGCPLCTPYRASLLTGQFPLTHGLFVNDVSVRPDTCSMADAFAAHGYDTAYIGKWHIDGHGRSAYIPPERRLGFQHWQVLECTHEYNHSAYYAGDDRCQRHWDGYDASAQTRAAQRYVREHGRDRPFLLLVSWGPPHDPYDTAPPQFAAMYRAEEIQLRPNVPSEWVDRARTSLAGYYAHCSALDACLGDLEATLEEVGIAEDTLLVFTSDHGDCIGCHGHGHKQVPWDESTRVPFVLRWPKVFGQGPRVVDALIDAPDIMPTLLALCGLPIPASVEGLSYADFLRGGPDPCDGAALLGCYHPMADWWHGRGGREYRGLRTSRYTYVRTLQGPWLLYDNLRDPYQLDNLVNRPERAGLQRDLDAWLQRKLAARDDAFLPGLEYMRLWGYPMDERETVPYTL